MARIRRSSVTHDRQGRPIIGVTQHLSDDGRGNITSYKRHHSIPCSNCHRQITELSQVRGKCQWCGKKHTCDLCDAVCQCCSRRLCGSCRSGFAGDGRLITVCPRCLKVLQQRQAEKDRMAREQAQLRKQQAYQQMCAKRAALRIQAAKLKAHLALAARREANRMRLAIFKNGLKRR